MILSAQELPIWHHTPSKKMAIKIISGGLHVCDTEALPKTTNCMSETILTGDR